MTRRGVGRDGTEEHADAKEEEAKERKLELERETLKDLTPQDEQAEGVKGGPTTPAYGGCYCGSA